MPRLKILKYKKYLKKKQKYLKHRPTAIFHFQKTKNNVISTLTDLKGNTIAWVSAGSLGMHGSRKATVYAGEAVAKTLAKKTRAMGIRVVLVKLKGLGYGKNKAINLLKKEGLAVTHIIEKTPTPFNGCRPPKKARR
jgi:small subunit ribosomal protein S11